MIKVVKLSTSWCPPCKALKPLWEDLKVEFDGQAEFQAIDLDNDPEAQDYPGISSVPTILFFKDGELAETMIGLHPYTHYTTTLSAILGVG